MNISEPFIRRPIGTSLLAMALFLLGLAVFPLLPVAPLPQVDFPTIQVTARLPGGNPETMATSVAQPLEREFSTIPGLVQMSSENALGVSRITLQFALDRNIDGAALDARTGRILAIGYGSKGGWHIDADDEAALIRRFYQRFTWAYRNNKQMVGFNSDSFDLPWIVRRGLVNGLRPPVGIRTADKRRWANTFVDLLAVYQSGQYRDYISLAHAGLMFGCQTVKTGDGAHFYQLFERDRAAAVEYLKTDLRLTWELGEKLFVLE